MKEYLLPLSEHEIEVLLEALKVWLGVCSRYSNAIPISRQLALFSAVSELQIIVDRLSTLAGSEVQE